MNIFQTFSQRKRNTILKNKVLLLGKKIKVPFARDPTTSSLKKVLNSESKSSDPDELVELEPNVSILGKLINETLDNLTLMKDKKWVINLENPYKKSFNLIIDCLIWISLVSSLYFLAFNPMSLGDVIFDNIMWVIFVIDIILNFFTEFIDAKKKKIQNLKLIARNYAKKWMIIDIITVMPFRFINNPNAEYLLRLFRILKINRLYDDINIDAISNFLTNLFYKSETRSKKKFKLIILGVWDLIKELITMIFAAFIISGLWIYYSKTVARVENKRINFFSQFNLDSDPEYKQFLKTLYFIFSTLMTVGYGDFYPTNSYEMGFDIIILIAGPTWFAFTMGKSISIINDLKEVGGETNKIGELNLWISNLESKTKIIPFDLKKKIKFFYLNYWKNDRLGSMCIVSGDEFNYESQAQEFIQMLPNSLKIQVMEYVFDDVLYSFKYFFEEFKDIKYELALCLFPSIYQKNSVVLDEGDFVTEIVLVTEGAFDIGFMNNGEFKLITCIKKKIMIGDYFMLKNIPSFLQFRAVENVYGYILPSFALKFFLKTTSGKIENYLGLLSENYEYMKKFIFDSRSRSTVETNENTGLLNYKNAEPESAQITNDCILSSDNKDNQSVFKELDNFDKSIKKIKRIRSKRFWELKKKIADYTSKLSESDTSPL